MNWTHDQLKSLNYHLHEDGQYYPYPPPPKLPDTVPQHHPVEPLVPPPPPQKKSKIRTFLRIERVSTKLQDFDNFVGGTKMLTDQLKEAGLIHDDDPASIVASYHQQKCKHRKDEKMIVQITYQPCPAP